MSPTNSKIERQTAWPTADEFPGGPGISWGSEVSEGPGWSVSHRTLEGAMKTAIREKLLRELAELERLSSGGVRPTEKPAVNIVIKRIPVVTKDQWERLEKAARDPSIQRRRVAQPPAD